MAFVEQMSFGLDAVNISFLASDDGVVEKRLPLVVTPRWNSSNTFLTEWCRINRAWMDEMLLKYGAILVRGFEIDNARELEQVIQGYRPDLSDTYRGTSPRKLIQGTKYVFSAGKFSSSATVNRAVHRSISNACFYFT